MVISEKATLEGVVEPVTRRWGVDWLAVGGFNSATRMHDLADEIAHDERRTIVLYIGDWDPSGMYMSARDFPTRLDKYGAPRWTYDLTRVALDAYDIEGGELASFEAEEKKTDARYKWFIVRYGETCVEVDALNPNELRDRVDHTIRRFVDMGAWERNQLAEEAEKQTIMDVLGKMRERA